MIGLTLFLKHEGLQCRISIRAGSVSVFGVGIGIRYFRRYFFHVGSVFGISEILVENRKFLVYPTSIWHPC